MAYTIGQTISQLITLRDPSDVAITGLAEIDFDTLEAYLLTDPLTTTIVSVDEIDQGQYSISFDPPTFGTWVLHYIYTDLPTNLEASFQYEVGSTATTVITFGTGTWTYGADFTDASQEVRFMIQDTDPSFPLFTDAEISYALGKANDNVRRSAIGLVQKLMARYAAMADVTELDLSVRASQLFLNAKALLDSLLDPFTGGAGVRPYAGGISHADIDARNANTDRVSGVFDRTRRRDQYGGYPH